MSEIVDYINTPIEVLDKRGKELSDSLRTIDHCPERKHQIQTEMSLIAFEMWHRYQIGEFEFVEVTQAS